jgi:RecA-family ATPase
MELAIAVAEGGTWMGRRCSQGRVLYVNLEIDAASSMHRFAAIYEAMGEEPANAANIDVWNLRGRACPMDRLAPRLIHRAAKRGRDPEHGGYSVVIIDPIYKILVGDENSASDMGAFCNQFDLVCAELGCSVVYCHHHSKGYQGAKHSVDRMSGSGVFARDPDAILDMTPLAATGEELKAARDGMAMAEIRRTLDERGIDYPEYREAAPFSVWAHDHLYRADAEALSGRLKAILEGASRVTAWRVTFTLREFEGIGSMGVWFDYPLHVPDVRGVLARCPYDGGDARSTDGSGRTKAQARDDKQRDLELAFDALSMEGDAVTVAELAEYLEVSERTVQRRVDESRGLSRQHGTVRRRVS